MFDSITPNTTQDMDAVNFVVLGHARCGSNLLGRALAMHPQVRMAGELLANELSIRQTAWEKVNRPAWPRPRGDAYQIGENAADFISGRVFSSTPWDNIRAFGFKIFYDHARDNAAMKTIWDYLDANPVRIIHIQRGNLLAAYVSNEIAQKTNEWHRAVDAGAPTGPQVQPFAIDPTTVQRYFETIISWRAWTDKTFANHDVLQVSYEDDLCNNFGATANKAFEFIRVMPWISRPAFQKQQAIPLDQQIANFAALRKHFKGTPYAQFFAETELDGAADAAPPERKGFLANLFARKAEPAGSKKAGSDQAP